MNYISGTYLFTPVSPPQVVNPQVGGVVATTPRGSPLGYINTPLRSLPFRGYLLSSPYLLGREEGSGTLPAS